MSINISGMRSTCKEEPFLEAHLAGKEPFGQFDAWFKEACDNKLILEPNAMCLSTATKEGRVSARFVLLKGYGKDGFKFFTNYSSRKGHDLTENPSVAATFYWEALGRAIRIEGTAEKVPVEEFDKYFHVPPSEPTGCKCNQQSTPVASRNVLCERVQELEAKHGDSVPRPECWGGYLICHTLIEFLQNQPNRLSDRIRFRKPEIGEIADGIFLHQGEDGRFSILGNGNVLLMRKEKSIHNK